MTLIKAAIIGYFLFSLLIITWFALRTWVFRDLKQQRDEVAEIRQHCDLAVKRIKSSEMREELEWQIERAHDMDALLTVEARIFDYLKQERPEV